MDKKIEELENVTGGNASVEECELTTKRSAVIEDALKDEDDWPLPPFPGGELCAAPVGGRF